MKHLRFFISLAILSFAVYGKPLVVSSVYPIFDFVSTIAQNETEQIMLIPPSNDPHSFEPTPKDVVNLTKADLFFYMSPEYEPWAQKFAQKAKRTVAVTDGKHEEHEDEHAHEPDEHHDPHIWLDPHEVIEIIETITQNLNTIVPLKKDFFEQNAQNLISQISALDEQYKQIFAQSSNKTVFYAGHNAFAAFAERYGLSIVPVTKSFSSTSEPSAKQIAAMVDEIKASGAKYICYDALESVSLAQSIAKETGIQIMPLYSIHTATKDDFAKKIHYIEYMKRNYENLLKVLK